MEEKTEKRKEAIEKVKELMNKDKVFLYMFARDKGSIKMEGCALIDNFDDLESRGIAQLIVEAQAEKGIKLNGSKLSEANAISKIGEMMEKFIKEHGE